MLVLSCSSPSERVIEADREIGALLAGSQERVLGGREAQLVQPTPEAAEPPAGASAVPAARTIDLQGALLAGFSSSREFQSQRDNLSLAGLSLSSTRFDFGPQLNAALTSLYSDAAGASSDTSSAGTLGVSQLLPSGGTIALDTRIANQRLGWPGDSEQYETSAEFSIRQPLMRGSGYLVSHEPLTQAERDLVYAVRQFELFRQDHAISIASDYFDLVRQRSQLVNEQRRYEEALFDREKAEALRQLDRNDDEDVFLARRNEISAENSVLVARAEYEVAVDSFRIRLGLPDDEPIVIADEQPPFSPVRLDADSAVRAALANRLDLTTAAEQLDDSRRNVVIAADELLPDVGLDVGYGRSGIDRRRTGPGAGDGSQLFDDWASHIALDVEIPIQRTLERNNYRAAMLGYDRALREHEELLESIDRDVRDALRQLLRTEKQIDLQVAQIEQERRAVAVTQIRYEAGDVENRDLLEARQALVDAENALIGLEVDHFISRLRLYRELGLLSIEPSGMWRL